MPQLYSKLAASTVISILANDLDGKRREILGEAMPPSRCTTVTYTNDISHDHCSAPHSALEYCTLPLSFPSAKSARTERLPAQATVTLGEVGLSLEINVELDE